MANLPTSNVKRLLANGAAGMRVSAEGTARAIEAAERYLNRLGRQAASIARAHGRKTIMPEDVEAAAHQV